MKKQCIKTFKQIYKDRIIKLDSKSIWKGWKLDTYNEAKNFLIKHPNCIKEVVYE